MKILGRTFVVIAAWAACAALAHGVAFITNLKGDVAVEGNARPLLLAELAKGQRITLGRDAAASVMFIATGKEYALRGPAEYTIKDTEVASSSGMPPLARSTEWRASDKVLAQVAQTAGASVRMRSIAVKKPDRAPKLLYPTEGAVSTLQPTLQWRGSDASAKSQIVLAAVGQDKPIHQANVAGASYRLPVKLKPDTEYLWKVSANGDEIGNGTFRTLSAATLREIEKRRPSERAEFSDRVLFTLLLQESGAVQEAREAWARLSQERSDLPELEALSK